MPRGEILVVRLRASPSSTVKIVRIVDYLYLVLYLHGAQRPVLVFIYRPFLRYLSADMKPVSGADARGMWWRGPRGAS